MLINLSDEELQLPRGMARQAAMDEALDTLKELLLIVKKYKNDKY